MSTEAAQTWRALSPLPSAAGLPALTVPAPRDIAPPRLTAPALPPAPLARVARRHRVLVWSFALLVLAPVLTAALYLWTRAADQYVAVAAFSVQEAEPAPSLGALGGLQALSGATHTDAQIVAAYLRSPDLIAELEREIGLARRWSLPAQDPVFAFDAAGGAEDLEDYWARMVTVTQGAGGLIDVSVRAFSPSDSHEIAAAILARAEARINALGDPMRADRMRLARADLARAEAGVVATRRAVEARRRSAGSVDPAGAVAARTARDAALASEIAALSVRRAALAGTTSDDDPRLADLDRRLAALDGALRDERGAAAGAGALDPGSSATVAAFEALEVDRRFAEEVYLAARAGVERAEAEALRQARYLVAHVRPTLPELSRYPDRPGLLTLVAALCLMPWLAAVMGFYAWRDRR